MLIQFVLRFTFAAFTLLDKVGMLVNKYCVRQRGMLFYGFK